MTLTPTKDLSDLLRLCPLPPPPPPPRASGGANNMHPLSWGGGGEGGRHKRKRSDKFLVGVERQIGFFPFVPPPPPSTFCIPPLKSTCHHILNRYVKIWHVRLRCAHNMHPLSWEGGGHKRKRSSDSIHA